MNKALKIILPVFLAVGFFSLVLITAIFGGKSTGVISIVVATVLTLPFFIPLIKEKNTVKIALTAILTALNIVGRIVFVAIPSFKPVTALTVIAGMYLGGETGFICGALTAVISNFYFGMGPWTPFQMLAWGLLGLIAGFLSKPLQKSKILLSLYGIFAGILFSVIMDVFTTVYTDNAFKTARFLAFIVSAVPMTVTYAVSNVIFLLLLEKPIGKKITRIKTKYF